VINMVKLNPSFWNKKRVLITGHTGFKGSWLSLWLSSLGAEVMGYALEPLTSPSLFNEANVADHIHNASGDIRDYETLLSATQNFCPEIIFHMAAQSLVRESYINPVNTYETNLMGTVNILETARHCKTVETIINVTTDKCYENMELVRGYREEDRLGGRDPYSNSKACSELVTQAYKDSFLSDKGIGVATVRAGNVIGGGDWSTDRLIPDFFRAYNHNVALQVRKPNAIRPWQYILEPLSGYMMLAERLQRDPTLFSGAWNFGPIIQETKSVAWIVEYLSSNLQGAKWISDEHPNHPHEASILNLDISKVADLLGWSPRLTLEETLSLCMNWNRDWTSDADMSIVCLDEITKFMAMERPVL